MISADALRYFLFVVRRGRLVAAAESLGVDHTTVSRQIGRLERSLGVRLFDRAATGWTLTEAGHHLLPHAEAVDSAVSAATELCNTEAGVLAGTVRIATPDAFGSFLLAPGLGPLRARYPDLDVQIVTWTRSIAIGMREFDVAVTLEEPQARHAAHRKLTDYSLGLYASPIYMSRSPALTTLTDLRHHPLIWYVDDLLDITPLRLLDDLAPGKRISIQTNSVTGHWQAALAGLGVALLPNYIGRHDGRLVRALPQFEARRTYWLAVPKEFARLARVKAAVGLLEGIIENRREDLT